MKTSNCLRSIAVSLMVAIVHAQPINSGSDGHDGAFNPTQRVTIDMADHPDGIYHYTSVNIPENVDVSFTPNANNTPVIWLVQGNCVILGRVFVAGMDGKQGTIAAGGPGGWQGGGGGSSPTPGQGPGGGGVGVTGGSASYGTLGTTNSDLAPGPTYGNIYLLPLMGGSGGGAPRGGYHGGGGGGGAILIASSGTIAVDASTGNGGIFALGGSAGSGYMSESGGGGSGGAIRLVASKITGNGTVMADGGMGWSQCYSGKGRVRFDTYTNEFVGRMVGMFSQGLQTIIISAAGQGIQLSIASIAGNNVSATPGGILANPDVIIPAQQSNPIPVVVSCANIPLNTEISVVVHPANGTDVQAVGINNAGNLESSTATVSLNMPRGGGIIYAKCVSGVAGLGANTSSKDLRTKSLAETGWTADGERFAKMEVTAVLGHKQQIAYLTESGKRYTIP